MKSIAIIWLQYGPYHFARAKALRDLACPTQVHALEVARQTALYQWTTSGSQEVATICPDDVWERLSFLRVFLMTRRKLRKLKVDLCFVPSYSPCQPLAVLLAAKSLGIPLVVMNDSHADTAASSRLGTCVKRWLVALCCAALVAGQPQRRYMASLGTPAGRIFTGYDAVDNDFFSERADEARQDAESARAKLELPKRYFLSLGRFVEKKNLETLIQAYSLFLKANPITETQLVFVGSGEMEASMRSLCVELGLKMVDHAAARPFPEAATSQPSNPPEQSRASDLSSPAPSVHFYGFRQIDENPAFYAFADAFILPSLTEEWGLVVNEAMACGIPVIVSETAGCAEDLIEPGRPDLDDKRRSEFSESLERTGLEKRIRQNGFVFDPRSADELAQALLQIEFNPDLRQAMGNAGRKIVDKFSCRNFARNALLAAKAAIS